MSANYGSQEIQSDGRQVEVREEEQRFTGKHEESKGYPRGETAAEIAAKIPNFIFGDPNFCTYCGERPNSVDHVIPLSSYQDKPRKGWDHRHGVRTYSCTRCNSMLGATVFETFQKRLHYIREKHMAKSRKFKNDASWTDDEISKLDHTLRTFVANRQTAMRRADAQLTWMETFNFRLCMATLRQMKPLQRSHPTYREWLAYYFNDFL